MHAWEEFVKSQEDEFGSETVRKWLLSLKIIRYDACNLYLEARDSFQMNWFEEHVRPKLKTQLLNNNKKPIKVHLSLANTPDKVKKNTRQTKPDPLVQKPTFALTFDQLDPLCTFQHFVNLESDLLTQRIFAIPIFKVRGKFRIGNGVRALQVETPGVFEARADAVLEEHVVGPFGLTRWPIGQEQRAERMILAKTVLITPPSSQGWPARRRRN